MQDAGAKGKGEVQGPVVWDMSKQDWVPAPKKAKQIAGPRSPRSGEAARPPGMKPSSLNIRLPKAGAMPDDIVAVHMQCQCIHHHKISSI